MRFVNERGWNSGLAGIRDWVRCTQLRRRQCILARRYREINTNQLGPDSRRLRGLLIARVVCEAVQSESSPGQTVERKLTRGI